MQKFANMWARPQWRSICGALSQLLDVPAGNRLWFDTADIAALQDGEMERAQAALVRAQAVLAHVQSGAEFGSAVVAVNSGDVTRLKPTPSPAPLPAGNVQHLLPQAQPGAVANPLPPMNPRLDVGPVSPGDGGDGSRPTPRPASARRGLTEANGRG
jgi:hypothetical protein